MSFAGFRLLAGGQLRKVARMLHSTSLQLIGGLESKLPWTVMRKARIMRRIRAATVLSPEHPRSRRWNHASDLVHGSR